MGKMMTLKKTVLSDNFKGGGNTKRKQANKGNSNNYDGVSPLLRLAQQNFDTGCI